MAIASVDSVGAGKEAALVVDCRIARVDSDCCKAVGYFALAVGYRQAGDYTAVGWIGSGKRSGGWLSKGSVDLPC